MYVYFVKMSEVYFDTIDSQSQRFYNPSFSQAEKIEKQGCVPRQKCQWNESLKWAIISFFQKLSYPYRQYEVIPFEDPLRSEIRRFLVSVDAYIESPNPVIPICDLLNGAADREFSKTLKRIKRKSFEITWGVEHFEFPDWWKDVPGYRIKDIGDIFNYSYLIFWEGESDDYLHGFIPVKIDKEYLATFKQAIKDILPDRALFQEIDHLDTLIQMSSSSSYDRLKKKKSRHYLIKDKYLYFSKHRGSSVRTVISVSPENHRDTVICDPSDLNTISLIDKQVMEILRLMPGHIHLTDKNEVNRRLYSLLRGSIHFIQRDMKKEGITKPRELLRVMLEALNEEYPDIEIFKYTSFYDTFSLILEGGEEVFPCRGHGLGMANALTTLMQLAIHHMIIDELTNDIPDMYGEVLCINDDFVAGFNETYHLDEYWEKEDEVMEKLSLLREPTKSFTSYLCFVLAERYLLGNSEYEKISYQIRELMYPLTCFNITHAKDYFIAAQMYCSSKYAVRYIEELKSFWGYEFFPQEFEYPHVVGGWINERINGVDMSLEILEQLDLKSYVLRGFEAAKACIKKRKTGSLFRSPIYILFGEPDIPDEYKAHFDMLPESIINDKYGRLLSHSPRVFKDYWKGLYNKRQKVFKKTQSNLTYEELLIAIKQTRRATEFYPNRTMIKKYHPIKILQAEIYDPYIDPNARLACLSLFNNLRYPFKETFSINFVNPDATSKKTTDLLSKEVQRSLKSELISVMFTGRTHEVSIPDDDYHPEEDYINPIRIGEITSILNWGMGYPEPFERYRDSLIEEKRRVFGRLLTLEEQYQISLRRIGRDQLRILIDHERSTGDSLLELLHYLDSIDDEQFIEKEDVDSDEESTAPFRQFSDNTPPTVGHDPYYIRISDLLEEGCPVLYQYRSCEEQLTFDNEEVRDIFGKLSLIITISTTPAIFTMERRLEEVQEILNYSGPIFSIIAERSGVLKLTSDQMNEIEEPDLDGFDIFAEEDY